MRAPNRTSFRSGKLMSDINVVPYIDVMLVLLVIFMVSTPLLTEGVYVDLPEAEGDTVKTSKDIDRMVVSIDKTGKVYVSTNGSQSNAVDKKQLSVAIQKQLQRNQQTAFYVKGDRATPYGEVVKLMASLQDNGVPNVGLITQAKDLK